MVKVGGFMFFMWMMMCILILIGWVMNVITIVNTMGDAITGLFVLRAVGIFVVPLGGILGYV